MLILASDRTAREAYIIMSEHDDRKHDGRAVTLREFTHKVGPSMRYKVYCHMCTPPANEPVPMPGDAVRYIGERVRYVLLCGEEGEEATKPLNSRGRLGVIDGPLGKPVTENLVVFNVYGNGAFRGGRFGEKEKGCVSASGGPAYYIAAYELEYTGETVWMPFWCWKDFPRANGGEHYTIDVPVWNWGAKREE